MSLSPQQISTLRELEEVWPDTPKVIIGATALGFYVNMSWHQTEDVDLIIAVELNAFPGALSSRKGWIQHPNKEHAFTSPQGVSVDLLPAGPDLIAAGELVWPSGHTMNLASLDLAFAHADSHNVDGYGVRVAPPRVITVLKMRSYLDRPAARRRDLQDIAYLLRDYVGEDDARRWDEPCEWDFELASAYYLGVDVGRILATSAHVAVVDEFLARVGDPDSTDHAQMQRQAPQKWRDGDALEQPLNALRAGLDAARGGTK